MAKVTLVMPEPFNRECSLDYIERVVAVNTEVSCEDLAETIGVSLDTIHLCAAASIECPDPWVIDFNAHAFITSN